ncbi:NusA N-terminal domain-containing protein [Staphylococcus aureus]
MPRAVLIDAIEAALITAYKKNYDSARNVRVELNMDQGTFKLTAKMLLKKYLTTEISGFKYSAC